ncbi:MAG: NAD(P)H-hydrate epimerase [Candidatus Aquicultor sp.]
MKKLLSVTAEQMREIDRVVAYNYGLQPLQLAENAGRALARASRLLLDGRLVKRKIIVLAGTSKNAAGGLAAARNLHDWGAHVEVALATPESSLKKTALTQLNILRSMDVEIGETSGLNIARLSKFDLIIDALLGYSASGPPAAEYADAINAAHKSKKETISLDVPSGLNATTGLAYDPCVIASATVTLGVPKTGLLTAEAAPYVGQLWLADIGIPPEVYATLGLKGNNPFLDDDLVLIHREEAALGITATA